MGLMAQAQNNGPRQGMKLLDLTEEQTAQLKELRLEQMKSSQKFKNQMGEIKARQRTLSDESPINQKALEKLVDEKTTLMNAHLKEGIAHKVAASEVLTEEQQIMMKQMHKRRQHIGRQGKGNGQHAGQGKGMHSGQGKGMRGGQGRGARMNAGNNQHFRGQNQ